MEANASKYSLVWKKSTLRLEEKLKENIQATLAHIHALTLQEAGEYADEEWAVKAGIQRANGD
jgi:hypothetical protein